MHTAMRVGMDLSRRIRKLNPDAHLCFYGLYATLNAEYLLSHGADSVIGGEFEQPLCDLVGRLCTGEPSAVTGVTASAGGPASAGGAAAAPHLSRQTWLVPDRDTLPGLKRYAQLDNGVELLPAGYTETTRGCLHTCLHCPITPVYNGRFFAVPADVVLADVAQQVRMGARHITFGDPDFLNGPTHVLRILRRMSEAHPGLTFDFTTKIEHILRHPSFFSEARDLGGIFVVSAVESVSDLVLTRLKKGHTRDDIVRALAVLRDADLPMRPSLVAFTPWTTLDDYLDMLDFVEVHDLVEHIDPVQYTIRLLVPPGSALLAEADTRSWIGELDEAGFTYAWRHDDARMDRLHQRGFTSCGGGRHLGRGKGQPACVPPDQASGGGSGGCRGARGTAFSRHPAQTAARPQADRGLVLLSGAHGEPERLVHLICGYLIRDASPSSP